MNMMKMITLFLLLIIGTSLHAQVATNPPDDATLAKLTNDKNSAVVRSYYELPEDITVVKSFAREGEQSIIEALKKQGITCAAIEGGNSVGAVWGGMHGTANAPFGGSMLGLRSRSGISLTFKEPQSAVGMTITRHFNGGDIGIDMLFLDKDGKLIRKVNANPQGIENGNPVTWGAVFRGLKMKTPEISSVHVIPARIPDNPRMELAFLDYLCYSSTSDETDPRKEIEELVKKLGAQEYKEREGATTKLMSLHPNLLPILRRMDPGKDPEIRLRLERVVESLEAKKVNLTPKEGSD